MAVAESLTGGLVVGALTETPGASATVRGGLVVYATDLKATLAGVDADLLAERGAVDPDVAAALARGARERLDATIGLGVTGVAGPDPQDDQPVGTVFVAVVHRAERPRGGVALRRRPARDPRGSCCQVCLDVLAEVADELAEASGICRPTWSLSSL